MLSAAVVLGLLAWGHVGHAFCRTTTCAGSSTNAPECEPDLNGCASRGVPLFWPNRCVAMAVQESGSQVLGLDAGEVQALLSLAASQWTGADCLGSTPSLQFITLGAMSCDQVEFHPEGPNANAVFFRDEGWEHGFSTLGLTSVSFAVSTGEIHGADIEFNSTGILDGFAPQLERIVTHELGHVLGLAHSRAAGAIMNERYSVLGMTAPALTPDDVEAICAVYPPGVQLPACEPRLRFDTRCGGPVEASCWIARAGSRGGGQPAWIVSVALGAVFGLRRSRRPGR